LSISISAGLETLLFTSSTSIGCSRGSSCAKGLSSKLDNLSAWGNETSVSNSLFSSTISTVFPRLSVSSTLFSTTATLLSVISGTSATNSVSLVMRTSRSLHLCCSLEHFPSCSFLLSFFFFFILPLLLILPDPSPPNSSSPMLSSDTAVMVEHSLANDSSSLSLSLASLKAQGGDCGGTGESGQTSRWLLGDSGLPEESMSAARRGNFNGSLTFSGILEKLKRSLFDSSAALMAASLAAFSFTVVESSRFDRCSLSGCPCEGLSSSLPASALPMSFVAKDCPSSTLLLMATNRDSSPISSSSFSSSP